MKERWQLNAAIIGGDGRQLAVARSLAEKFTRVKVFGHPETAVADPLEWCDAIRTALVDARVVVLPITGVNSAGMVRGYRDQPPLDLSPEWERLAPGTLLVTGSLPAARREDLKSREIPVIEYAEDDEIAILNSIPTAEGAVQIAMEELPITIHGSTVLVLGFGRVGVTVARTFRALGARVIVAARRPALLARAIEMGCATVSGAGLAEAVSGADIIINSVPAMVLTADLLAQAAPDVLIIDLASSPGGVDFEAAARLNIKAKLYPGLPGIVAPETAGAILASSIPKLIDQFLLTNGGVR
ncbi:dipicolinate synthase subunit A [Hydrogenispora ethanolica]|uniref:Dipicolinate synthase subunit A n=1 Tax=Hydrogenispora ethanolica TaxID=1082276 RepID=A0A4R1R839_HYDET|nr:dipicolinate synthase subunit DpsA [Hydrogenispora ethanolica]TCL61796.1 dipicolinate synthase subunit A [Hydrogenispora ethanolica]